MTISSIQLAASKVLALLLSCAKTSLDDDYLLFKLSVALYPFSHAFNEVHFGRVLVVLVLKLLLQDLKILYLRPHDDNLGLGVVELHTNGVDFLALQIESDMGK